MALLEEDLQESRDKEMSRYDSLKRELHNLEEMVAHVTASNAKLRWFLREKSKISIS